MGKDSPDARKLGRDRESDALRHCRRPRHCRRR